MGGEEEKSLENAVSSHHSTEKTPKVESKVFLCIRARGKRESDLKSFIGPRKMKKTLPALLKHLVFYNLEVVHRRHRETWYNGCHVCRDILSTGRN